jgi:hypothetical protein
MVRAEPQGQRLCWHLNFQPLAAKTEMINFYHFKPPVCGTLLWHPWELIQPQSANLQWPRSSHLRSKMSVSKRSVSHLWAKCSVTHRDTIGSSQCSTYSSSWLKAFLPVFSRQKQGTHTNPLNHSLLRMRRRKISQYEKYAKLVCTSNASVASFLNVLDFYFIFFFFWEVILSTALVHL